MLWAHFGAAQFMAEIILYFTFLSDFFFWQKNGVKWQRRRRQRPDKGAGKVGGKGSSTYITSEMKHVTLRLTVHTHTVADNCSWKGVAYCWIYVAISRCNLQQRSCNCGKKKKKWWRRMTKRQRALRNWYATISTDTHTHTSTQTGTHTHKHAHRQTCVQCNWHGLSKITRYWTPATDKRETLATFALAIDFATGRGNGAAPRKQ